MRGKGDEKSADRLKAVIGVAAFHAVLGYALVTGLGFEVASNVKESMKMFNVAPDPPPPPPEEPPAPQPKAKEAEGEASPPNLKAKAAPVVVPPPKVRLEVPPKVATSDRPSPVVGSDKTAGNSNIAGPGTGSGGTGTGTGSGGTGTGSGGGGQGGGKAQRIRGGFTRNDYVKLARGAPLNVSVAVSFVAQPNGSVKNCVVRRSSGRPDVDAATCRFIEQRFVYKPATDAQGRPVSETLYSTFFWEPR